MKSYLNKSALRDLYKLSFDGIKRLVTVLPPDVVVGVHGGWERERAIRFGVAAFLTYEDGSPCFAHGEMGLTRQPGWFYAWPDAVERRKAGEPILIPLPERGEFLTAPLVFAAKPEVVRMLSLSRVRVNQLHDAGQMPDPVVRVGRDPGTGPKDEKVVFGWSHDDLIPWAKQTGRHSKGNGKRKVRSVHTGRPKGSGDYASLPRCGRPTAIPGKPCRGVCKRARDGWAPACAMHLTDEERAALESLTV